MTTLAESYKLATDRCFELAHKLAEAEACIKTLQTQNDNCMIDKGRTLTEIASYCAEECHAPACGGCPLRRVGGGRS